MKEYWIEGFENGPFRFFGAWCIYEGDWSMLLSKNRTTMILSKELLESIKSHCISDDLRFKLVERYMASYNDFSLPLDCKSTVLNYFIIDITKSCNLDCVYCFRKRECHDTITSKQLQKILEGIYSYCQNHGVNAICIQMWGGEPLIAFDRIEQVYRFFNDSVVKCKIDIETNGTLITDEVARKLYDMNVSVGVSLDGSQRTHDRQRAFVGKKPSFESVKNGIMNLKRYYGDNISVLTVITRYNISSLREMLGEMVFELGLRSFKFNIVLDNRNAEEGGLTPSLDQIRSYYEELIDEMLTYYQMGILISEGNIAARLSNLLRASTDNYCCSKGCCGGRKLVSIDFNGDVYPCELTDFKELKLANIADSKVFQMDFLYEKSRAFNFEKEKEKCTNCPWQCYCLGGCSSRLYYIGQKSGVDEFECAVNQTIYAKLAEILCEFPELRKDVMF